MGEDRDPEGEMSFAQPDHENTFTELFAVPSEFHAGAAVVGIVSLLFLLAWDRSKWLKSMPIPSALLAVVLELLCELDKFVGRRVGYRGVASS